MQRHVVQSLIEQGKKAVALDGAGPSRDDLRLLLARVVHAAEELLRENEELSGRLMRRGIAAENYRHPMPAAGEMNDTYPSPGAR